MAMVWNWGINRPTNLVSIPCWWDQTSHEFTITLLKWLEQTLCWSCFTLWNFWICWTWLFISPMGLIHLLRGIYWDDLWCCSTVQPSPAEAKPRCSMDFNGTKHGFRMFPLFPLAPIRWYAELQRIVGAAKNCPGRGARMYKHLKWLNQIRTYQG